MTPTGGHYMTSNPQRPHGTELVTAAVDIFKLHACGECLVPDTLSHLLCSCRHHLRTTYLLPWYYIIC